MHRHSIDVTFAGLLSDRGWSPIRSYIALCLKHLYALGYIP